MFKRIGNELEKLAAERPVLLAFLVFLGAAFIIIPATLPFYYSESNGFLGNVVAEAYGTLYDLLIIGCFTLWLNRRAQNRIENNRYREEIEDFLGWRSPEASHRIAGSIRRLNRNGVRSDIRLTEAFLKGANLSSATLRDSDLWGAYLREAKLGKADLSGANLAGADLEEADMERADLHGADFRGANLKLSDLERADLRKANLGGADLEKSDLQYAILVGADLQYAKLTGANMREVDLEEANLNRADLRNAHLPHADLREAQLDQAKLEGADLQRVNFIGVALPEGDDLIAMFGGVKTLFGARFEPEVEKVIKKAHPQLFERPRLAELV